MKSVFVISLGCSKNLIDTEQMMGVLLDNGYNVVYDESEADIVLINTCGFIDSAVNEAESEISAVLDLKKAGHINKVVVVGCYVQRFKQQVLERFPEIDAVLGVGEQHKIADVIQSGSKKIYNLPKTMSVSPSRLLATLPHTAYLKIADGCDNCCSYCTIPLIRGGYRSKKIDDIISEAEVLVQQGVKELSLIAQDTTSYGKDLYGEPKLVELIKHLVKIKGLEWIRLLYTYPEYLTEELLETIAREKKVCSYLDVPLQHISDRILRSMNRKSTEESIRLKIKMVKKIVPQVTLRTTFIVGYPGESEDDFRKLEEFIQEVQFNKIGVFEYRQEKGTKSADLKDQVDEKTKKIRAEKIIELQSEIVDKMNVEMIGKEIKVLMDSPSQGRSAAEAPDIDGVISVIANSNQQLSPGDFVKVKITEALGYHLKGVLVT